MYKISTIGHSNRVFSEFLQKLQENKIDTLVDVRTFPRSRFCPQYNQKSLLDELNKVNITYLSKGKNLGGRGKNIDYEGTIDELTEMVKKGKKLCVMCSEKNYEQCHRYSMLTPSFEMRGVNVEHIGYN